ncbi:Nif11 family protein [Maridesulfovibrio frigidus]|uniref:Nif11 family protein n=1 Tax=Maridesulfovibrio frigidus TaxID=340956 RepID=UPI0004E19AA7|nr:Nif11 family protein [Maridesulfovibrio frigidus]
MSGKKLIEFIELAQQNEKLGERLTSIKEPENNDEKQKVFEKIVSIGAEYKYSFTTEDCDSVWKDKKKAVANKSLSGDQSSVQAKHCIISGFECKAIAGVLK